MSNTLLSNVEIKQCRKVILFSVYSGSLFKSCQIMIIEDVIAPNLNVWVCPWNRLCMTDV